ncbi:MAG: FliI/YscN family ATPase [Proteobacteria bacterium]|nr:FliI/YscN family ATPase [Pseudomonadota bacterium]
MNRAGVVEAIAATDTIARTGRLTRILPGALEADGPNVAIGTLCSVGPEAPGRAALIAEVIKVDTAHIALAPYGEVASLATGMPVRALGGGGQCPVGDATLGRVVDALGRPIDEGGPISGIRYEPVHVDPPPPLARTTPAEPLNTGLRAIDGLLTVGRGQRVGIFAASGVGKTSLITQIARQAEADCTILCLVGERGREVEHLWMRELDADARAHTTMVVATSDQPAALRVRAVYQALALARHWRAVGQHVLLIVDSATRLAMAIRETGLDAGEPPTVRAYPPSTFATLPRIVEQCGALRDGGAITALFTVLSETDEIDDPISELMKSLLDGHLVLSRALAERGHFPAIDVPRSVSRNFDRLVSTEHHAQARAVRTMLADYDTSRLLVESGLYTSGGNPALDQAIAAKPAIDRFLMQGADEAIRPEATQAALALLGAGR